MQKNWGHQKYFGVASQTTVVAEKNPFFGLQNKIGTRPKKIGGCERKNGHHQQKLRGRNKNIAENNLLWAGKKDFATLESSSCNVVHHSSHFLVAL